MNNMKRLMAMTALVAALGASSALAIDFKDERGDDYGAGEYIYPTDAVYKSGSFDLTKFKVNHKGEKVSFEATLASKLEDPWRMGMGFSVQMIFIFIDTDGVKDSGFTTTPPGLNVEFAPEDAWDVCVILSPQPMSRVREEADGKAGDMAEFILVPSRVKGSRSTISGTVDAGELLKGDPSKWGFQVLVQSNEGFPSEMDLLTRKVNEYEGQHRFGGGTDYDCDPHVIDILGDNSELGDYECNEDGTTKKLAVIHMIR